MSLSSGCGRALALAGSLWLLAAAAAHAEFAEASAKIREAVVTIQIEKKTGTGFIVNSEGWVLTNKHVLGEAKVAVVKLQNGDTLPAKVERTHERLDLCLLKVNRQHLPTVQFGSSGKLKQGQDVAAVGAPFGLSDTLTKGVVSAVDREIEGIKYLQIDAALNQGNSGGPIINEDGDVVGVATKAALKAENMGFAIPSNDVMSFLREANITFQAGLDAADAAAPPPAEPAPGAQPAPPATAAAPPAIPQAPLPGPGLLANPWAWLAASAVVAFVVSLITALIVSGHRRPEPVVYAPPAPQTSWQPPVAQVPAAAPAPAAPPARPPQASADDLSDIEIELK